MRSTIVGTVSVELEFDRSAESRKDSSDEEMELSMSPQRQPPSQDKHEQQQKAAPNGNGEQNDLSAASRQGALATMNSIRSSFILEARRKSITRDPYAERRKKPPVRGRRLFHKVALGLVFLNLLRRGAARSRLVSKDSESTKVA